MKIFFLLLMLIAANLSMTMDYAPQNDRLEFVLTAKYDGFEQIGLRRQLIMLHEALDCKNILGVEMMLKKVPDLYSACKRDLTAFFNSSFSDATIAAAQALIYFAKSKGISKK